MLDSQFLIHNSHLEQPNIFTDRDPHLARLKKHKLIYQFPLLYNLPKGTPGIYTVAGGRQIGKTTLLKQWMWYLLRTEVRPQNIVFITGEVIDDHHSLIRHIQEALINMSSDELKFILVDEITYIKDWDKAIKFLADGGFFQQVVLVLTGSDLLMIQEARMRFPGRRGAAEVVDFHLYPLSFREFINLQYPGIDITRNSELLSSGFRTYLIHGGYLTAINDYATSKSVSVSTLMTYSDWIRGDSLKRGKSEHYLREFFSAILRTYGSQVTWNSLSHHVSIDHPRTLQDYANMLVSMDVLFVQHAIIEDKLVQAPKKAKKLYFSDPFIYQVINYWLNHTKVTAPEVEPLLVETAVVNIIKRNFPTYYIKAIGEVDVAYVKDNRFWPVEIKWTNQLRPKDIKQIQKYNNSLILTKVPSTGFIGTTPAMTVPSFLYSFG